MSRFNEALSLAAAVWIFASASAMAAGTDGVRAFGAADFMTKAQESVLDADEAKHMERIRANPRVLNAKLFKFNMTALDSNVVTVVTPEGKTFQYVGKPGVDEAGIHNWQGKSATGWMSAAYTPTEMVGSFYEDGKTYRFGSVGKHNRFASVVEMNLPPEPRGKDHGPLTDAEKRRFGVPIE